MIYGYPLNRLIQEYNNKYLTMYVCISCTIINILKIYKDLFLLIIDI